MIAHSHLLQEILCFLVMKVIVCIITIRDKKLHTDIDMLLVMIPEAITTNPSRNNNMMLTFKNLHTCWIKRAITSVPPVAQA